MVRSSEKILRALISGLKMKNKCQIPHAVGDSENSSLPTPPAPSPLLSNDILVALGMRICTLYLLAAGYACYR